MDYMKLYDKPNKGALRSQIVTTRRMFKGQHNMAANENGIKLFTPVWRDMIMDLFGRRLGSVAGSVDYDYEENVIIFSPGGVITNVNDRVGGNQEINHQFEIGVVTFKPHVHWWQSDGKNYEFTMRYRLQRNGQEKETIWTTLTTTANDGNDRFEYLSGTINQITKFSDITINVGHSDTFQVQLTRTDSEAGDIPMFFFDMHGRIDRLGTNNEFTQDEIV